MITSHSSDKARLTDAEKRMIVTASYFYFKRSHRKSIKNWTSVRCILEACKSHSMPVNQGRLLLLSNYLVNGG